MYLAMYRGIGRGLIDNAVWSFVKLRQGWYSDAEEVNDIICP